LATQPVIISINDKLCKGADGCGICLALCPKDVFKIARTLDGPGHPPPQVDKVTACTNCGNCMIYCPDMAIVVRLEEMPRPQPPRTRRNEHAKTDNEKPSNGSGHIASLSGVGFPFYIGATHVESRQS